jgi:hypothetical protein
MIRLIVVLLTCLICIPLLFIGAICKLSEHIFKVMNENIDKIFSLFSKLNDKYNR